MKQPKAKSTRKEELPRKNNPNPTTENLPVVSQERFKVLLSYSGTFLCDGESELKESQPKKD